MSDQNLRRLCAALLLRAAHAHGGTVYTEVAWEDRVYPALDLVWDGPDRVMAVAFCWTADRLSQAREEFLLFQAGCTMAGVYKKHHLVLFHPPGVGGLPMDWPVGISVSPIQVDEAGQATPGPEIQSKLGSLIFYDEMQTAAALQDPPDWRRFLTPERVEKRIKELAAEKDLPPTLRKEVTAILNIAHGDPALMHDKLHQYLTKRWRESR